MKNLINESPDTKLYGRVAFSLKLVDEKDIKDRVILDVGCGYGWMVKMALQKKAKKIYGMETSVNDLTTITKSIKNSKFFPVVGLAEKIPLKNNTLDTVTAWEVIEHIPKDLESTMFSEVNRVLKRGGVFYLSTPLDTPLSKFMDPAWWLIGHRHYTPEQLQLFAQKSGFKTLSVMTKGNIWEAIFTIVFYVFKWVFRSSPPFEKQFAKNIDMEYSHEQGKYELFVKFKKV